MDELAAVIGEEQVSVVKPSKKALDSLELTNTTDSVQMGKGLCNLVS